MMRIEKLRLPQPLCPECGSIDLIEGDQTIMCNRCGETSRRVDAQFGSADVSDLPLDEIFRRCG